MKFILPWDEISKDIRLNTTWRRWALHHHWRGTILTEYQEGHPSKGDLEEIPHTPTIHSTSVADAYDLQHRAHNTEQELSIERAKVAREIRRNRRLQSQINEYVEALARCVHDCGQMKYHCDLLSNSNLALSQELQKAKLMVETLEAVIQMLYNSPDRLSSTNSTFSKNQPAS